MTRETVPGINEIKKMEDFGNFEVEKVVKTIECNKDIILKVEPGEGSISIYLNDNIDRQKLVSGIVDMYNKFCAISTDLDYEKGKIRILKFWWVYRELEETMLIEDIVRNE